MWTSQHYLTSHWIFSWSFRYLHTCFVVAVLFWSCCSHLCSVIHWKTIYISFYHYWLLLIHIFRTSSTGKLRNLNLIQVLVVCIIPWLHYCEEIVFASTNRDLVILSKERSGQIPQDSGLKPQMISVYSHTQSVSAEDLNIWINLTFFFFLIQYTSCSQSQSVCLEFYYFRNTDSMVFSYNIKLLKH